MPITKETIEYTVDLTDLLEGIDDVDDRERAAKLAGQEALNKLKEYVSKGNSPVDGQGRFTALDKAYRSYKRATRGTDKPNLSYNGDMLAELDIDYDEDSFTIFIDEPTEIEKAYNHNVGDTLPKRQFIPNDKDNELFKQKIRDAYKRKIKDFAKSLPKKTKDNSKTESSSGAFGALTIKDFLG